MSEPEIESAQFLARHRGQRQELLGMREEQNDPCENVHHPRRPRCNCARPQREDVGSNQARQLVNTIREFLRLNIFQIKRRDYDHTIRNIIKDVWKVFRDSKKLSKNFLTVLFNQKIYLELAVKYDLKDILDKYYERDYRRAMDILKAQLCEKLMKANLERIIRQKIKIKNCYRIRMLIQYINDFVDSELDEGNKVKFYRQEKYDKQYAIYKFKEQRFMAQEKYLNQQIQNEQSQGLIGFPMYKYPQQ